MPPPILPPTLETSKEPVNGYQVLVAMLLMPLASALAVASWTLYALLSIHPIYVLLPVGSGALLAWPAWRLARRNNTCSLMQWLLLGLALALGWFGVANQPGEFLLVGGGLGLGGGCHCHRYRPRQRLDAWLSKVPTGRALPCSDGRRGVSFAYGAFGRSSLWLAGSAIEPAYSTHHGNAAVMAFRGGACGLDSNAWRYPKILWPQNGSLARLKIHSNDAYFITSLTY